MSKGWYVKVDVPVVFSIDCNIGVLASTEEQAGLIAQELVCDYLSRDDWPAELENALPWELYMGGLDWNRGSQSGAIDFDGMQAVSVTPDSDFDPDPEPSSEDQEDATEVRDLMEAAQCLNEAYYSTAEDHPLREWQEQHGIASVRDQINLCAIYCEGTYRIVKDELGFDGPFDLDFCPQFLENCVDHKTFMPKSENLNALAIHWKLG